MPQVLITSADNRHLSDVISRVSGQPFSWAYLGQSIDGFKRAARVFNGLGDQIETTDLVHRAAESMRKPYLTYLYEIGKDLASLRWWITGVSYRSSYVSKTFHQACHLKVALDLVEGWSSPAALVFVVADKEARIALNKNLAGSHDSVTDVAGSPFPNPLESVISLAKMLVYRGYFVWRETYRLVQTRRSAPGLPHQGRPTTLIVSWATQDNLKRGPGFFESFFGDLATKLDESGSPVAVVPMVLKEIPFRGALNEIQGGSIRMMMPHRYLTLMDILRAAISSCARPPQPKPIPRFNGLDIGPMIDEELSSYRFTNWAADVLLMVAMVKRWARSGDPISRVIYLYENQPWERALCWAVRRYLPSVELVGYQHSRVPRLALNWYLAPGGESEAPLPHRVVTVGKHTARLLVQDGYDPNVVRVGGALQMQSLLALRPDANAPSISLEEPTVLVACSIGHEETAELIDLALKLVEEDESVRVLVKCHPMKPFQQASDIPFDELPANVHVTEESISDLIFKSSLMVYSGSTVCIQALALGLPVVHLRTSFDLDMDPLEAVPDLRLEATGLEELQEKVRWLIDHREEYISQHQDDWDRLVEDMYGPVNEDTVHAFID